MEFTWKNIPAARQSIERAWCPVLMNNFQTRVLGSEIRLPQKLASNFYGMTYPFLEQSFCNSAVDMEAIFERAAARLESMAVVGTVERLGETLDQIFSLFEVPVPTTISHENTSPAPARTISPAIRELVERENRYDLELYRLATNLLERGKALPPQDKPGGV
jgi:hypothetical protein